MIRKAVDALWMKMCVLRKFRLKGGAKYGTKEVGFLDCGLYQESIEFYRFFTENQK